MSFPGISWVSSRGLDLPILLKKLKIIVKFEKVSNFFPVSLKTVLSFLITSTIVILFTSAPLFYKVSKHVWEMPASDYICKIPTLTPKLWLFKMPDTQNYLLGFRRAVQSYKSWFLHKSSSGSKGQNNTVMVQLFQWAQPDFTIKRDYKERPHSLPESFVHFRMVALRFLVCNQTVLNWELTRPSQGVRACVITLSSRFRALSHNRTCDLTGQMLARMRESGQGSTPGYQSKSLMSRWFWEMLAHMW